ncbi:hypothetical protein [Accumulibacter sp.]|nr:hypothetical protein [Accumulibacter sp.]MBL8373684.1 hypothetical protein [Accumulibacter sp.]
MKIPTDAMPPLRNVSRELEEDRKAEPVGNAARLANELSTSSRRQPPPFGEQQARAPSQSPTPAAASREQQDPPPAVERRQQPERRSENRPVLLDTRARKGRRQNPGEVRINIKV